jgi:Polyketide cyclase / dehydrase and lipid transport
MAAIVESIEISRRGDDVFSYAVDPLHFREWQHRRRVGTPDDSRPLAVGSKTIVVRRVGPRRLPTTEEVVELDRPRSWAVRGTSGPVVGIVRGTVESLYGGRRSRLTITFNFDAHGVGKLLVPLIVRRQVRKVLPRNERKLKEILESGTPAARSA